MYDLLWNIYAQDLTSSIRNAPFIIETAKHVIKMAMREAPCYTPTINDLAAPVRRLTDIFLNVYRIRYHLPVFMQSDIYNGRNPVYYSLHKHTFFHPIPQRSNPNRTIDELVIIQKLVQEFSERVLNHQFDIDLSDTILYQTLQEARFDFYHPQGGVRLNTDIASIVQEDKRFMTMINEFKIEKDLVFPDRSVFFNGCIRIQPKEESKPKPSMKDFITRLASAPKE